MSALDGMNFASLRTILVNLLYSADVPTDLRGVERYFHDNINSFGMETILELWCTPFISDCSVQGIV
jgi:hypothetical protein